MNVTQHVTNPWGSGWMDWRNNGAKDPLKRVALGLLEALIAWGSDADLDRQSLFATGMVPIGGSTYPSVAYGVRAFRRSIDALAKKYYRMLTRRATMSRGELLTDLQVFEELLEFLRSTRHLHGWRFEVKFRSSVVGGHPIEPRWLKVLVLHVASAGMHLMRTGRMATHVEPQPVWLDRCGGMLCDVMYEAAVMRWKDKARQRVILQVRYGAGDQVYPLVCCTVSSHTVSSRTVLSRIVSYCVVLCRLVLCRTVSYCVVLCRTVCHHTEALCRTVSYCVILCRTVSYCVVLYCVVLCRLVLCSLVLRPSEFV